MFVRKAFLAITFLFSIMLSQGRADCFIAKEKGRIVKRLGKCEKRHSPFSTFKVALALIGFETAVLKSLYAPEIHFTSEVEKNFGRPLKFPSQHFWYRTQNPASWIKYSVLWYSQEIVKRLGRKKFEQYIKLLKYGNEDMSGNSAHPTSFLKSWLGSSLQISPLEQVIFIEKLHQRALPLSSKAQEETIKLLYIGEIWDGWQLYGKTGGGRNGWFIGWIQKEKRVISFAQYHETASCPITAGRMAREIALDHLVNFIFTGK